MIDLLYHIRFDVPTLAQTNITFYGALGYVMFCILILFSIYGMYDLLIRFKQYIENGGK